VAYAHLLNLNVPTFAAIGLVSVLAGAANTRLPASIMAIELFGPAIGPYATILPVRNPLVLFSSSRASDVYPSQVLSISQSPHPSMFELGKEIEEIQSTLILRPKGFISRVLWLIKENRRHRR